VQFLIPVRYSLGYPFFNFLQMPQFLLLLLSLSISFITMKAMRILAAAATLSVGNALTQHVEERKLMSYVSYTHIM